MTTANNMTSLQDKNVSEIFTGSGFSISKLTKRLTPDVFTNLLPAQIAMLSSMKDFTGVVPNFETFMNTTKLLIDTFSGGNAQWETVIHADKTWFMWLKTETTSEVTTEEKVKYFNSVLPSWMTVSDIIPEHVADLVTLAWQNKPNTPTTDKWVFGAVQAHSAVGVYVGFMPLDSAMNLLPLKDVQPGIYRELKPLTKTFVPPVNNVQPVTPVETVTPVEPVNNVPTVETVGNMLDQLGLTSISEITLVNKGDDYQVSYMTDGKKKVTKLSSLRQRVADLA